jgi:hypothetical protein
MSKTDVVMEQDAPDSQAETGGRATLPSRLVTYIRRHHVGFIAVVIAASSGATATALSTEPVPVLSLNGSAVPGTTGGAGKVVTAENAKAKILPWNNDFSVDGADIDTDSMHSYTTTPEVFRIVQPGIYTINARIEWLPGNGVGDRTLEYRENGNEYTTRLAKVPAHTYTIEQEGSFVRRLDPGDTIRFSARQTSGESLGVLGRHVSIIWVGP